MGRGNQKNVNKKILIICSDCSSSLVTLQFSHSERWKGHSKRSKTSTFLSSDDWPVGSFSMGTSTQERHPTAVKGTREVARTAVRYSWYTAK